MKDHSLVENMELDKTQQRELWNYLYLKEGKIYGDYPSQLAYDVMRFVFSMNGDFSKDDLRRLRALEIGGGYGRNARYIADWGINTTLLDISSESLRIARNDGLERKIKLFEGDIVSQEFDEKFDIAYANFVFHVMKQDDREAAVANAYKAIKRGGYLLGSFLSINDRDFDDFERGDEVEQNTFLVREKSQHFFTREELNRLLSSKGFTIRILEEREDPEAIMQVCRNTRYWFAVAQRGEKYG